MWIVRLALRRPYTFVVASILIVLLGALSILRTPTDIFPNIDIPVVSIIWNYTGLDAQQMSDRIVSPTERSLTTTVDNIQHVESQSLDGIAVVKVFLQPNASLDLAITQITANSQTQLRNLPAGTTPPLVITYSASTVPIFQVGLSGQGLSEQQLNDLGLNFIRTGLITVPGAAVPYPYGGKVAQVMIDLDPAKLQARGLAPADVVNAITAQNLILPSGTSKIGALEYDVNLNAAPRTIEELNDRRHDDLRPRCRVGTQWLLAADQHRARRRTPRRATRHREGRKRIDAGRRVGDQGEASTGQTEPAAGAADLAAG
jgi:multidrug efflux pump subunit AcrB